MKETVKFDQDTRRKARLKSRETQRYSWFYYRDFLYKDFLFDAEVKLVPWASLVKG